MENPPTFVIVQWPELFFEWIASRPSLNNGHHATNFRGGILMIMFLCWAHWPAMLDMFLCYQVHQKVLFWTCWLSQKAAQSYSTLWTHQLYDSEERHTLWPVVTDQTDLFTNCESILGKEANLAIALTKAKAKSGPREGLLEPQTPNDNSCGPASNESQTTWLFDHSVCGQYYPYH